MKKYSILCGLFFLFISATAQNLAGAKKMLYYERFKSAIKILEPIVAADNKDVDAAYWLGQVYLQMSKEDISKAKTIYEKSLAANPGNPLLLAGIGHVYALENREKEAQQKFTAAEAAAVKNPGALLAIARAAINNGNNNLKNDENAKGPVEAIPILNKALLLKDCDKADAYILLGNANRLLFEGGEADKNYRNALEVDPKNALAYLRLGKIYQTQRNDEVMLENYERAIQVDPAFAPAYLALYDHFSYRDVNKAKEYLDKYIKNSDADCKTELFAADYLFRAGKYNEALTRSAELQKSNCAAEIGMGLKLLNAFCYSRLNDSINAKNNITEFMAQEKADKIQAPAYELAAKIFSKFPGEESKAIEYYNKAFDADSNGRVGYLMQLGDLYKKINNPEQVAANWDRLFTVKPRPSNVDLYNRAMAHMAIKNYVYADSLWQMYKEKYPDQIYGYANRIKCNEALDTSFALAAPHYEAMVAFAGKDTVKYKAQLVGSLYKLVVYNVNIKKDIPKAIEYLSQYLLFDPSNEEAVKLLDKMKKTLPKE